VPALYVGVDAGGSRVIAAAARGDEVPCTVLGEAANPNVVGTLRAAEAVAQAIERVCGPERAVAIAVGVAGAGREEVRRTMEAVLTQRFPAAVLRVTDDAHIALRAAIPSGDGMVLIAGTGSIAYAEIGDCRLRAGGLGYLLGDEGSGYAIGAAVMRALARALEGHVPHDATTDALARHLGIRETSELIARVYESPVPIAMIAGCAPLVLQHAAQGDRSATKIVQAAASALFELVRSIVRLCRARDVRGEGLSLAFSGGLLKQNSLLTYLLQMRIANEFPEMTVVRDGEPWRAALDEARSLR
jgi:N-acetylglucosamine kinase-like BadF-type ATPase